MATDWFPMVRNPHPGHHGLPISHHPIFLWGVKGNVYTNNPQMVTQLEENIHNETVNIELPTLGRVYHNFVQRIDHCIDSDGGLVKKT